MQHVTASIGSCGNHATATQCFVKNVPPASGSIVHATCRLLQSCSNIRWMTCFLWHLTYDITIHIIRLSLKEGCFGINVEKIPTFACCHLATHPKSWSCGRRRICLLIFPLFVLETSQYPSGLRPEEVALLVRLDGEHPFFNPGFPLEVFRSLQQTVSGILVLPGLTPLFMHGISSWLLLLRLFPQVVIQGSSMSLV